MVDMKWPSAAGRRAIEGRSSGKEVPFENNPTAAQFSSLFDVVDRDPAIVVANCFHLTIATSRVVASLAGIGSQR